MICEVFKGKFPSDCSVSVVIQRKRGITSSKWFDLCLFGMQIFVQVCTWTQLAIVKVSLQNFMENGVFCKELSRACPKDYNRMFWLRFIMSYCFSDFAWKIQLVQTATTMSTFG